MARSKACATAARASIYEEVTNTIIAELEEGCVPWVRPWGRAKGAAPVGLPANAASGRPYSGINILILWAAVIARGFTSQRWLTFRQALELGGHVRKGERGASIVYANRFVPQTGACGGDGDPREVAIPFLKRFTVFSVDQCDGLPADLAGVDTPAPDLSLVLPQVRDLIESSGADLRIGGDQAYYMPALDRIHVPQPEAFHAHVDWHRTALHELGHWTGHPSRLARDHSGRFGSAAYAREELVAELCSAFCCAALGIVPTVRHADYIGSWLDLLRADARAVVRAASAASRAADFLLRFRSAAESVSEAAS